MSNHAEKDGKAAAARRGRAVAEEFNRAAQKPGQTDPVLKKQAGQLLKTLPFLAVKFFEAGQDADIDELRAHAQKGPAHIEALIADFAATGAENNAKNDNVKTPLTYQTVSAALKAPVKPEDDLLEQILAAPAPDPDLLARYPGNRQTLLYHASTRGNLPLIQYLHQHGADITADNNFAVQRAAVNGHLDVVRYLHEHGVDIESVLGTATTQTLRKSFPRIAAWERLFAGPMPAGLEQFTPRGIKPDLFSAAQAMMACEGYKNKTGNIYAYHLSRLFGSEDRILRYLQKWGVSGKQPLHDIAHAIDVPQDGKPDLKAWGDAVLKFGPAMAKLVKFSDRLPRPLATLKETRAEIAKFAYRRGEEFPAMAGMCFELAVDEDDFNDALDLYLKQKAKGFPAKNIPDIFIDGEKFSLPGARFYRLAPDDARGLFLGEYVDCCQSIGGMGEECAAHGFTSPDGGFYVVETAQGKIIGECWAWRGKKGEMVFDSLETLGGRVSKEQWQMILKETGQQLANRPQNITKGITTLLVGTGGGTPQNMEFDRSSSPATPLKYSGYRDSSKQYTVWQAAPAPHKRAKPGPR